MSGLDTYAVLMVYFPFVVVSYAALCGFKDIIPHARMSAFRESTMDTERTQQGNDGKAYRHHHAAHVLMSIPRTARRNYNTIGRAR